MEESDEVDSQELVVSARSLNRINTYMDKMRSVVKEDETTKRIAFLTGCSAYAPDPINLFLRGPSSTGKTYVTMEVMRFFPPKNVEKLGGLSPQALVHDYGHLVDEQGTRFSLADAPRKEYYKIEDTNKTDWIRFREARLLWDERLSSSHYEVDLRHKILVFLESPPRETFMRLRPILSHDTMDTEFKFTDKIAGKLRTTKVVLKGWPATIFCTTDTSYVEELATRSLSHTPDMSIEKYQGAVELLGDKASDPVFYLEYKKSLAPYQERITAISNLGDDIDRVQIPYAKLFSKEYNATLPRDMRDYSKFQGLIEASAVLHFDTRPIVIYHIGDSVYRMLIANYTDLYNAMAAYLEVEEASRAGVSAHIIKIFYEIIVPRWDISGGQGITTSDIHKAYITMGYGETDRKTFYKWIDTLEQIGWVEKSDDPTDRRRNLIHVSKIATETSLKTALSKFQAQFGPEILKEWFSELLKKLAYKSVRIYENISKINLEDNIVYDSSSNVEFEWTVDNISIFEKVFGLIFFECENLLDLLNESQIESQITREKKQEHFSPPTSTLRTDRMRNYMSIFRKELAAMEEERGGYPLRTEFYTEKIKPMFGFDMPTFLRVLEACLSDKIIFDAGNGLIGVAQ